MQHLMHPNAAPDAAANAALMHPNATPNASSNAAPDAPWCSTGVAPDQNLMQT